MRDEFLDTRERVIVHSRKRVDKVFLGIDPEHSAVLGESEHHGSAWAGVFMSDEEPVFCAELDGAQGVFGKIVIDARRCIEEALSERASAPKHVVDRLGNARPASPGRLEFIENLVVLAQ